ncbi:MAG: alpha/beta hydrolase [Methanomicrobiaceae archaeon]|nr:alpha/beta hydrolase [Methanomicrobiaceae archaeon]
MEDKILLKVAVIAIVLLVISLIANIIFYSGTMVNNTGPYAPGDFNAEFPKNGLERTDLQGGSVNKTNANGIEIAYREYGSGEPLLMITGYSATMGMWPPELISGLSENYHVIIFDNRGAGNSSYDDREFTIPLFADDAKALLDSIGIEQAHIFGWSMGTNTALEMAHRYPDSVMSMTLYAADCGGKEEVLPDPEVYKTLGNTSGTAEERGMRLLKLLFPQEWFETHPDVYSYFPVVTETVSPKVIGMQYRAMENWNGSYMWLPGIKQPVLLITGTRDVLTPPENSLIIAERIEGSWLVRIKDSGHGVMYQYPDEMASVVKIFIENNSKT